MNENREKVTSHELEPLKLRHIAAYGSGEFGIALTWQMTALFLLNFFTDVYGITAAAAGTIFLIARPWDAVNDPIMGFIADRTKTRWGNYRPYLLFAVIPLAVFNILLYITPDFSATGKFFWALVIYIFWGMAFTATQLPYGSLTAAYTQDQQERTSLAASRMFFSMLGILFLSVVTVMLVKMFPSDQIGYPVVVSIYTVFVILLFWLVFAVVRERVQPEGREKYSIRDMISLLIQNKALMTVNVAVFLMGTATTIRMSMAKYYIDYNLGNPGLFPVLMGIVVISMALGAVVSPFLNKHMEKKNIYIIGMILFVLGDLGIYFAPYTSITLIQVLMGFTGLGSGMVFTLVWAMVADTVEYGEWKTGKRAEGITYSCYSFFSKLAFAAGGASGGYLLHASGYVPLAVQTPSADHMIRALFTLAPVICGSLAVIVMQTYKLDGETFQRILDELKERQEMKH